MTWAMVDAHSSGMADVNRRETSLIARRCARSSVSIQEGTLSVYFLMVRGNFNWVQSNPSILIV